MESEGEFFKEEGVDQPPPQMRAASVPPNLTAGLCIANKYELLRKVGSGSMGEVWAATHLSLKEEVAIKIVLRDVAHEDGSSTDSRFLLEARVASQLSRKTRHIVSVTDHGEDGPYAYLVMELLNGESLDVRLARTGPMPLKKVIPLVYQVARALAVAHNDGIVHRDLKPSNIFVTIDEDGKALIKILDFGIAKMRASVRQMPINVSMNAAKHSTMRGFLLGTPAYMSPEQARGRQIDHRADVWALAVIAYHLLTAQYPFDGETPEELFARLCRVEPIPITANRTDLPPAILDLFDRAFSERLDRRFQSAVAFAAALEQVETMQRRLDGVSPTPLSAISLPPPPYGDAAAAGEANTPPDRLVIGEIPPSLARISSPPGLLEAAQAKAKKIQAAQKAQKAQQKATEESTITPAGVPSKRKTWVRVAMMSAVIALLLGLGNLVSTWREREAANTPHGLAAGATNMEPPRLGSPGRLNDRGDESIPAPDPNAASPTVRAQDLPPATEKAAAAPLANNNSNGIHNSAVTVPTTPTVVTTTASLPPDPPPVTTSQAAPTQPRPPPSKQINRSEVF